MSLTQSADNRQAAIDTSLLSTATLLRDNTSAAIRRVFRWCSRPQGRGRSPLTRPMRPPSRMAISASDSTQQKEGRASDSVTAREPGAGGGEERSEPGAIREVPAGRKVWASDSGRGVREREG